MNYALLGFSLVFGLWLGGWLLSGLLSQMLWLVARARLPHWPAGARARLLFALRVGPTLMTGGLVLGVALPAFVAHEPLTAKESLSFVLLCCASVGALGLAAAARRIWVTWRLTKAVLARWRIAAEPLHLPGIPLPVWQIQHPLPLVGVVGILRPQLFVASHLLAQLAPAELAAVLRHEHGHVIARDNLRRLVFDFCRPAFLSAASNRELETVWQESVEMAADEYAATCPPDCAPANASASALALASALLKIARLFPRDAAHSLPPLVATVMQADSGLARRVKQLAALSDAPLLVSAQKTRMVPALRWLGGATMLGLMMICWQPASLRAIHQLFETLLAVLP